MSYLPRSRERIWHKQSWLCQSSVLWQRVDTCCINKADHFELSEAIASMFRWYRDAQRCYVYLADVSVNNDGKSQPQQQTWEPAFRNSRWFTRGWTLQELIAPVSVQFFSQEEKLLGDKKMLEQHIHEITGIPITALSGSPLSQFSIEERLRWAAKRNTKRKEDRAYCLLGIFDIFIPLIYGEGDHAFIRLKEETHKRSGKMNTAVTVVMSGIRLTSLSTSASLAHEASPQIRTAMRLIKDQGHGNLSLVEYDDDRVPRYAILSHTWGANGEEVTFEDLMEGTDKNKAGYNKIEFCRKQAASDGLQHFWVDTCCINKSSSAEIMEAINSMFRWYQDATRCYVYLTDVSTSRTGTNVNSLSTTWETAFRQSRWFTRGWTLQDLIAPGSVEFFSREGDRIGNKKSLEHEIHYITGIAINALRGAPLTEFEIDERFSWAERRETKRPEDKAYSLLGIFNIHMPLLYGEGEEKALARLRKEIDKQGRLYDADQIYM
jgi:hypothetical protein